jgi:hypothetical protein
MRRRIVGGIAGAALAFGVMSASASASANPEPPGSGDCHADQLQFFKARAGTNSTEATADFFGVTVKYGQEFISGSCGKS